MDTELERAGRAPSHRGRFLKVCDGSSGGVQRCRGPESTAWAGSSRAAQSAPGSASHRRLNSVLDKVAQLESKIMGQKKHLELQNTDSGLKLLDEEWTSSPSGDEGGARGKKCWKNYGTTSGNGTCRDHCSENIQSPKKRNVTVKQLDLDSDREEMKELMGSSLGFSSGNGNRKVLVSDAQWGTKVIMNFAGLCIFIIYFYYFIIYFIIYIIYKIYFYFYYI